MANPASKFPYASPKFVDNGSGAKLLQPDNQVAFVSNDDLGTPEGQQALRDALVTAGIMQAS